jgi:hypothetical protein
MMGGGATPVEGTDFNDMAARRRNGAVKAVIESAIESAAVQSPPAGQPDADYPFKRSVILTEGDEIQPEPIGWL